MCFLGRGHSVLANSVLCRSEKDPGANPKKVLIWAKHCRRIKVPPEFPGDSLTSVILHFYLYGCIPTPYTWYPSCCCQLRIDAQFYWSLGQVTAQIHHSRRWQRVDLSSISFVISSADAGIPLGFQQKPSTRELPVFDADPYIRWPLRRYITTCWSVLPRANNSMDGLYAMSGGSIFWCRVFSLNSSRIAGFSMLRPLTKFN